MGLGGGTLFSYLQSAVVDEALGLRKSSMMEAVRLSQELNGQGIQQVVFCTFTPFGGNYLEIFARAR